MATSNHPSHRKRKHEEAQENTELKRQKKSHKHTEPGTRSGAKQGKDARSQENKMSNQDGTVNRGDAASVEAVEAQQAAASSHRGDVRESHKPNKRGKEKKNIGQTQDLARLEEQSTTGVENGLAASSVQQGDADAPSRKRRKRGRRRKGHRSVAWEIASSISGKYVNVAPIFASEKALIAATEHTINVFSPENSSLIRSLPFEDSGPICAYALSAGNPKILYVATYEGDITAWDWMEGERIGQYKIQEAVVDITCASIQGVSGDILFIVERTEKGIAIVTALQWNPTNGQCNHSQIVHKSKRPMSNIRVVSGGRALIATMAHSLFVGHLKELSHRSVESLKYEWTEISCPEDPTCFDFRITSTTEQNARDKKGKNQHCVIDVAVGSINGCIYVFSDVLRLTAANATPRALHWHREAVGAIAYSTDGHYIISGGQETVLVQWQLDTGRKQFLPHLESPIQFLTVSPSGSSYAIGLGDNSLMVLSAAELKPTAYYPELQSLSLGLTHQEHRILPTKDLFALRKDSVASLLNSPTVVNPSNPLELLLAVAGSQTVFSYQRHVPPAPYLQTFPLASNQHAARQALTRTNATDSNTGPEGNRIQEPNVTQLCLSSNGRWLASVDEWMPPHEDLEDLRDGVTDHHEIEERQRELNLRFWSWNEKHSSWALNTLIPSPHMLSDTKIASRILNLASDPYSTTFATIGQDSVLKLWAPKTRFPDGRTVRSEDLKDFSSFASKTKIQAQKTRSNDVKTWWTALHILPLERIPSPSAFHINPLTATHSKLAYTNDGSGLAVLQHFSPSGTNNPKQTYPSPPPSTEADIEPAVPESEPSSLDDDSTTLLHIIDTETCTLRDTRANMDTVADPILSIAFLERYLICLTRTSTSVWDVTTWSLHTTIHHHHRRQHNQQLPPPPQDHSTIPPPLLSVNQSTRTFALITHSPRPYLPTSLHQATESTPLHALWTHTSTLRIFSPFPPNSRPEVPLFKAELPRLALSLVAPGPAPLLGKGRDRSQYDAFTAERKGYIVVDAGASARVVRPVVEGPKVRSAGMEKEERDEVVEGMRVLEGEARGDKSKVAEGRDASSLSSSSPSPSSSSSSAAESSSSSDSDSNEDEEDETNQTPKATKHTKKRKPKKFTLPPRTRPDPPLVREEDLTALFDGPGGALPSIDEMFDGIIGLYGSGPRVAVEGNGE